MKSKSKLTYWIIACMSLGLLVGYLCHQQITDAAKLKEVTGYLALGSDIFLRLIKMIIAPLVFATLVSGIAGLGDSKAVGRIGFKAVSWFMLASIVSLAMGLFFVSILEPGRGLTPMVTNGEVASTLGSAKFGLKEFIIHLVPKSAAEAMANNEILQILVFSLFFGMALSHFRETESGKTLIMAIDGLGHVMLRITGAVMLFAPLGVFSSVAATVAANGLGVLMVYGKFVGGFIVTLVALWLMLVAAGYAMLGSRVFKLIGMIREPMMLAFSTASSESAYPKTLAVLSKFGIKDRLSSFVLPLGYSFNLDGSMLYQSFVALFVAQLYGIQFTLQQQVALLLVLLISSKGMAGVPRASLVALASVMPMFGLPLDGLVLILGIDQFLDMCRSATNVLGNSIATAVVAKWEGDLVPEEQRASPRRESVEGQASLPV